MELPDVVAKLVEIHQHDQHESGQDDTDKVTPSCCPLTDLKGFDSLIPQLSAGWPKNSVTRCQRELA